MPPPGCNMDQKHEELRQRLASLHGEFSQLSLLLFQAGQELQNHGALPSHQLVEKLTVAQEHFIEFSVSLFKYSQSLNTSFLATLPAEPACLKDCEVVLKACAEALQKRTQTEEMRWRAFKILNRVFAISLREQKDFLPLQKVHEDARILYTIFEKDENFEFTTESQRLVEKLQPFETLLTLIQDHERLDDERWMHLKKTVEQAFGDELTVQVIRGRLIILPEFTSLPNNDEDKKVSSPQPDGTAEESPQAYPQPEKMEIKVATEAQAQSEQKSSDDNAAITGKAFTAPSETPLKHPKIPPQHIESVKNQSLENRKTSTAPAISSRLFVPSKAERSPAPLPLSTPAQISRLSEPLSSDSDPASLAATILKAPPTERGPGLRDLVWLLILNNQLSAAYHLAQGLERQYPDLEPHLPAWLIRSLALSQYVRYPNGEIARRLREDFLEFNEEWLKKITSKEWHEAIELLLAASALRPALLAPITEAAHILRPLNVEGLEKFYPYCQAIAKYGDYRHPLDPLALKKVKGQAAWQAIMQSLQKEATAWLQAASHKKLAFAPATFVWMHMLKSKQIIDKLLSYVRQNDRSLLDSARKEVEKWSDDNKINDEVNRIDRLRVRKRGDGDEITARALAQILNLTHEAIDFVRRWINLQESRPDQPKGFLQEQAQKVRQEIWDQQKEVLREFDQLASQSVSLVLLSSLAPGRRAVENIRALFDPESDLPIDESDSKHVLHAELLRTSLRMNENWEPEVSDQNEVVENILRMLAEGMQDWNRALRYRCELQDHEGTARLLTYLEMRGYDAVKLEELKREREKSLRECRNALQRHIDETRTYLEEAVLNDLIKEQERLGYNADLETLELAMPEIQRFKAARDQLIDIHNKVHSKRQVEIERIRQRLTDDSMQAKMLAKPVENERILRLLEKGDASTANEYIDMLMKNQPLPEMDTPDDLFAAFFPHQFREIAAFINHSSPVQKWEPLKIVNTVRDGAQGHSSEIKVGPIVISREEALETTEFLEAWFTAAKTRSIGKESLQTIFNHFGFTFQDAGLNAKGDRTWIELKTAPLADKELCPVPVYGSNANGSYRVLCVWRRPAELELINEIGETSLDTAPVVVLYFGFMSEQQRRNLGRMCRERRRTFLVIDDLLLLYLCGRPRYQRLVSLFRCALPFTFLEPYVTTGGFLPTEMFFGREPERDALVRQTGSCFLYGGRQLGKTVLLREVQRSFHKPEQGRIAVMLDLKAHEIAYKHPIDAIWNLLLIEFKKFSVLPDNLPQHTHEETLLDRLHTWLEEDERRRILLLLDEADRFLESDGNDRFRRSTRLQNLMEKTAGRFKVVFAGLHDVQRTTTEVNHPLAKGGTPICIGPLLENGQAKAARELIERPLMSLGFRFESPDLVTRILAYTNYYPSLIQLFCNELLRHVADPNSLIFDPKTTPPYIITARHVDDVYRKEELRKDIRQRFDWTLQLDKSYEVLAYVIAHGFFEDNWAGLAKGFSVSWIEGQALKWWPEGFRESSNYYDIGVLLDEMVGLGVLRKVSRDYTLRSPNIVYLLGTQDQIKAQLQKKRETRLKYDPSSFRSTLSLADASRRSPLTAQQEEEFRKREHGVSVIFGCEAAGLSDLPLFVEAAFGKKFVVHLNGIPDAEGFAVHLNDLSDRQEDGITLALVMPTCTWGLSWVEQAQQWVASRRSPTKIVRIVFVTNPQIARKLVSGDFRTRERLRAKGVSTLNLQLWHDAALRQWLDDCQFPNEQIIRAEIFEATGNWPYLLRRFYESTRRNPSSWQTSLKNLRKSLSEEPNFAQEIKKAFGLEEKSVMEVLKELADLGTPSTEDLLELQSDFALQDKLLQTLEWAELLNLAGRGGEEAVWRLDPVVAWLLKTIGK